MILCIYSCTSYLPGLWRSPTRLPGVLAIWRGLQWPPGVAPMGGTHMKPERHPVGIHFGPCSPISSCHGSAVAYSYHTDSIRTKTNKVEPKLIQPCSVPTSSVCRARSWCAARSAYSLCIQQPLYMQKDTPYLEVPALRPADLVWLDSPRLTSANHRQPPCSWKVTITYSLLHLCMLHWMVVTQFVYRYVRGQNNVPPLLTRYLRAATA